MSAASFGARGRIELVAVLEQAGRGLGLVVGAERDDEDVGVVGARIGDHATGLWIDRGDRLLAELDAGLRDVVVGDPHVGGSEATEHDVELREAEHELCMAGQ
jgi:hypothetical protein